MILESQGANVEIKEITFLDGANAGGDGGNVLIRGFGAPHRILRCSFEGGESEQGGNLYVQTTGSVVVRESTFVNGAASSVGGGLAVHGASDLRIVDSVFSGNTASGEGGGVFTTFGGTGGPGQEITVRGSIFEGNAANVGGGIAVSELGTVPVVTVLHTEFTNNTVSDSGGALAMVEFIDGVSFESNFGAGNSVDTGVCPDFLTVDAVTEEQVCVAVDDAFP